MTSYLPLTVFLSTTMLYTTDASVVLPTSYMFAGLGVPQVTNVVVQCGGSGEVHTCTLM